MKITTADCVKLLKEKYPDQNYPNQDWKRISKKKNGNQIIRIFENREDDNQQIVYELNGVISLTPLEGIQSHFSFFVKDGVTMDDGFNEIPDPDTFRIVVGMGKEHQDESISLFEDNIGSHVPAVDFVMKQLGIECEVTENEFEGERHGKTNEDVKKFLISQGWYEDKYLNNEEE